MTGTPLTTAPRVRPVVQVAVGDVDVDVGQALYGSAYYGTGPAATYAGPDAIWSDVSCDVYEAQTWAGRKQSLAAFDVGTATIRVANPDGKYDYPKTTDATVLSVRPGRQIRAGVSIDLGDPVWLFHGWIDATAPEFDPTHGDAVVISAVDAKGEAGRVEAAVRSDIGAGDTVTARMARLAGLAGFPSHRRAFDETGITLDAAPLTGRVAALADDTARSGGGDVFGDNRGLFTYRNRDWQSRPPGTAVDGVIGNQGADGEVCPNSWNIAFDRSEYANRIVYWKPGATESSQLNDLANQGRYGVETFTLPAMLTQDTATVIDLAQRALRVRNFNLAPRVSACQVDAAQPGVIELLAGASPFTPSMYTCSHVTEDGRAVFARQMYLTGIEHFIDPGGWTATLALDDAAPWIVPADTRYGTAIYNTDRYTSVA